jgi:hypothetical protein
MAEIDIYDLSVEQEEYLVELLCTRGAYTVDWLARELDDACRAYCYSSTSPSSVADCASSSSLSLK